MDTIKIIAEAQENARLAKARGLTRINLPTLSFQDWATIFKRAEGLAGREGHRAYQKRNFYFKRFLEEQGIEVTMVTCRPDGLFDWAKESQHPLTTDGEKTHALTHYVSRPDLPAAQCVHKRPLTAGLTATGLELFATITFYGENPEKPEILSTVIHTRDGWVVESLEVLAVQHTPKEAYNLFSEFMAKHGISQAFHDPQTRRPQFCPDCNELLVNLAGPGEYDRLNRSRH